MKLRLFNAGKHRRISLAQIHSARGVSIFRKLTAGGKKRMARYDKLNSRRQMGAGNSNYN